MNIAVIFAGGTGQRMNSKTRPKQFLELHEKPILVYTLEAFQKHEEIDGIILVTLKDWINYCLELKEKYHLTKRENTILSLLMKGKDNNEISGELVISVNTLKKHILNIYRKLDINHRVQLFKMIKEKE